MPKFKPPKRTPLSPEEINRRYQVTLSILVSMLRRQAAKPSSSIISNPQTRKEISA